jgi:hypothetical protein
MMADSVAQLGGVGGDAVDREQRREHGRAALGMGGAGRIGHGWLRSAGRPVVPRIGVVGALRASGGSADAGAAGTSVG